MQLLFNPLRFRKFPELLKLTTMLTSVLVMLSLGQAWADPPGTALVWITAILALVVDSCIVLALGFELEGLLLKPGSVLGWPLIECVFSSFFAINYFISMWLCINAKSFAIISPNAFAMAATFCLAAFVQYVLNVLCYIRIWAFDQRKAAGDEINPSGMGYTNYGAP